jgi:acyl-CoA synthetase (NDP forming)
MADLLAYARIFEHGRRPAGRRVGIVTISGGVGVLLTDAAIAAGLEVPEFTGPARARVAGTIPQFGAPANPVDCTAHVGVNDRAALGRVLRTVAELPEVDMLCYGGLSDDPNEDWLDALDVLRTDVDKPAVVWCSTPVAQRKVSGRGIPCFLEPEGALRGLAALAGFWLDPPRPREVPTRDPARVALGEEILRRRGPRGVLRDHDARRLLERYGIPFPVQEAATDAAGAVELAERIGFPVALKALSRELPHKSDAGGVRLDLRSADEVRRAYDDLLASVARWAPKARVDSVLVQAMAPTGLELVVGMHRDPQFGPVVTVGMGGTRTEIMDRTASRLAPFGREEALRALAEISGGRLTTNPRGLDGAGQESVCDIAVAIGRVATELDRVSEIDLNPVIVRDGGATVVDVLVVVTAE